MTCLLVVDPVEGGSANNYDYVNADPINAFDVAGTCGTFGSPFKGCGKGHPRHRGFLGGIFGKAFGGLGFQGNFCAGYGVAWCGAAGGSVHDQYYAAQGSGHGFGWSGPSAGITWQSGKSSSSGNCHSAGVALISFSSCYGGHRVYGVFIGFGTGGYFHTRYRSKSTTPTRTGPSGW